MKMNAAPPIRILLAEDDELVRQIAEETLISAGFSVVSVGNGFDALESMPRVQPDIIVSDVRMPQCDGFQLLQHVRRSTDFNQIPFVIVSAKGETADQRMGMSLGADDYVTKPYQPDDLIKTVRARLDRAAVVKESLNRQQRFLTRVLPHELRTPLNGVIGYADIITQTGQSGQTLSPAELVDFGQNLQRSGQRLLQMAEDFSLWAWFERQRECLGEEKEREISKHELTPELVDRVCRECEARYGRPGGSRARVSGAAVRVLNEGLAAVVRHLVDNAFKFSRPGSLVEITGRANEMRYELTVKDSGRGMTPEQIRNIGVMTQFDREYAEQQGTGMGLMLSRTFAQLSGGGLELEENPEGPGLSARLVLPLAGWWDTRWQFA